MNSGITEKQNGKPGDFSEFVNIMFSFKKIIRLEFNSGFIRFCLAPFYKEGKFYSITFGKLRGIRAYYRKDINFHAMLGFWENGSLVLLDKLIRQFGLNKREIVVADVGANIGFYSLFFSKCLHPGSKIFAFEPSVSILDILKKNLEFNHASNVKIIEQACADRPGEIEFYIGRHHHQSSILKEWADNEFNGKRVTIKATTLDDFFCDENNQEFPDLIKMDIEGGAPYALKGCKNCISINRPFILIESHTTKEDWAIGELLMENNYEAFRVDDRKWVKNKNKNYKDREGVWGTMLLVPEELRNKFSATL
jgi:FkbM family methyltransferase